MTGSLIRPDRSCSLLKTSAMWAVVLLGANITGCNLLKSAPRPTPVASTPAAPAPVTPVPVVSVPAVTAVSSDPCAAQQREIERLQQLLAEKEALIRSQQIRQREPVKASQESTKQSSRIQVQLRQLPTQSGAAATIAEVETAMKNLKSSRSALSEQTLQAQAQRLLDAATAAYAKGDYAVAIDRAAQSRRLIDRIQVDDKP